MRWAGTFYQWVYWLWAVMLILTGRVTMQCLDVKPHWVALVQWILMKQDDHTFCTRVVSSMSAHPFQKLELVKCRWRFASCDSLRRSPCVGAGAANHSTTECFCPDALHNTTSSSSSELVGPVPLSSWVRFKPAELAWSKSCHWLVLQSVQDGLLINVLIKVQKKWQQTARKLMFK